MNIVFLRPIDSLQPRVKKMIDVAHKLEYNIYFIGAKRSKKDQSKLFPKYIQFSTVGIFYPEASKMYLIGTPVYAMAAVVKLFKIKPKIIHASDIEGAIPAVIYKMLSPQTKIMINVHDNFFARYKISQKFKDILKSIEIIIYNQADIVLFPDENRIEMFKIWKPKNYLITPNTPLDPGFILPELKKPIKLFVAGWLNWQRGIQSLLDLTKVDKNIELHIIGTGSSEVVNSLKEYTNIYYYGILSQEDTLSIGQQCHIVPIFYDPSSEINRNASPNKLFDALALGRPIIINKSIRPAEMVQDQHLGLCVTYGDVNEIRDAIYKLVDNWENYTDICKVNRTVYLDNYQWSIYEDKIAKVYADLADS